MRFTGPALLAAALAGMLAAPSAGRAQATFSDEQRRGIEQIVKEYLVRNPEVLQEAIAELEKRQQETQKTQQVAVLKQERDKILNSPRGTIVGNPSGDITLVEFFDYNCGYCKKALSDLKGLMRADPKLRVVLKDFPVLGPESIEASRVALAARAQLKGDKLLEYHVRLLETRGRVNGERAFAVAREMGLDVDRVRKDMESPEIREALQENMGLADRLGLSGTPAFIVGDEVIGGAVGLEPLRQTISAVRQCGKAAC